MQRDEKMWRRAGALGAALCYGLAALACLATIIPSVVAARADWLRRNPTAANVKEALRLDPLNAYGYTMQAELLEQEDQFGAAEQSWRKALERNPRDAEAWMRTALLAERRGAIDESERCLLRSAKANHLWLPRWSLVNFYARLGRTQQVYAWSRRAMERASDDVGALFPILQETDARPGYLLSILPKNRAVVAAWLAFAAQRPELEAGLEQDAASLAALIPQTMPGWPGVNVSIWPHRLYPATEGEQRLLLAVVDRMLDSAEGAAAARLWNQWTSRKIIFGDRWTTAIPLTNRHFRFSAYNAGLGWRLESGEHVNAQIAPESGEFVVHLDGLQPEMVELLRQRVYIPAGGAYQFAMESRTEQLKDDNSLLWRIQEQTGQTMAGTAVHPSEDWRRETVPLAAAGRDRVGEVVLICRRPPGSVRPEGTVRFRLVSLERVQ